MQKRKLFIDRKDGKRVENVSGLSQISIDLKPRRCDSDVYINQKVDVTNLVKYINKRKSDGIELSYFHAFVTALGKVIYNREKLNYFVANRHIYKHNDLTISFVAKLEFTDKSEEIMVILPIKENDNIISLSNKIREKVSVIRHGNEEKAGANKAIDILEKITKYFKSSYSGNI